MSNKSNFDNIIAVAQNKNGLLSVFYCGGDAKLRTVKQTAINEWSVSERISDKELNYGVVAIQNAAGRIEVFARNKDNSVEHFWQEKNNGDSYGTDNLGANGLQHIPVVVDTTDKGYGKGRLVLYVYLDNKFQLKAQAVSPEVDYNPLWSVDFYPQGKKTGFKGIPAVTLNEDRREEAFMRDSDDLLWHIYHTNDKGEWLSDWVSMNQKINGNFSLVSHYKQGLIYVFAIDNDGTVWAIYQEVANTKDRWSVKQCLPKQDKLIVTGFPVVLSNISFYVFIQGKNNTLYNINPSQAGSTYWSTEKWNPIEFTGEGKIDSDPAVIVDKDGLVNVFILTNECKLWSLKETAKFSKKWSDWVLID